MVRYSNTNSIWGKNDTSPIYLLTLKKWINFDTITSYHWTPDEVGRYDWITYDFYAIFDDENGDNSDVGKVKVAKNVWRTFQGKSEGNTKIE